MEEKVALVTGGTSGIGRAMLPELLEAGFAVHFIGRNAAVGQAIEAELNRDGARKATFIQLDLSDLKAVRRFAQGFRKDVPKLSLLANVAGLMLPVRTVTPEGFETTFAVNYLAAYVLSTELRPSLANAENARIVNVAGRPGFVLNPSLDMDDLGFEKSYSGMDVAIKTIHAKSVLTQIMAQQLKVDGITVNSFHPGAVQGAVGRNMNVVMRAVFSVVNLFMSKTSASGRHLTLSPDVNGVTGQFFVGTKGTDLVFEAAYCDALWTRTVDMMGPVLAAE